MSLLGNDVFGFDLIRKYIIYFGTLFNQMEFTRIDSDGATLQRFRVPILYGNADKLLARLDADPDINRPAAQITPRMSFEFKGLDYDGERKLPVLGKIVRRDDDLNKMKRMYNPVAYNLQFEVNVASKHFEDTNKIVEQILPFFTPEFTATVNLIPSMDVAMDIPIVLNSTTVDDQYEGAMEDRRTVVWTLQFTMFAYFYGPALSKPIIKFANTNFLVGNTTSTNTIIEWFRVQPGLDANGDPTSNVEISIPVADISVDDNFGYVVNVQSYANGSD